MRFVVHISILIHYQIELMRRCHGIYMQNLSSKRETIPTEVGSTHNQVRRRIKEELGGNEGGDAVIEEAALSGGEEEEVKVGRGGGREEFIWNLKRARRFLPVCERWQPLAPIAMGQA